MGFKRFERKKTVDKTSPYVSIGKNHFHYNVAATRLCKLNNGTRVIYHVDEDKRKLGFEFTDEDDGDSYSVFPRSDSESSFRSTSSGLIASYPWIASVAVAEDSNDRRLKMRPERKVWIVEFAPSFEIVVERDDSGTIPTEHSGIYRYRKNGEIMYIGAGNVRDRLREKGRDAWDFDRIEYSLVGDDDKFEWESYWIDEYMKKNQERLPPYNVVKGHSR